MSVWVIARTAPTTMVRIAIDPHHRLPVPAVGAERDVEEPQQRAERGDLGAGRHERGDRGRGALVDVGRPGVERRGADLEQQADGEHAHADQQQRAVADVVADRLVDRRELHRAGVAVEQRDAVEEEAGGERAEQEVLERRLLAEQPAAAGQPAQQVERQREHLERHEHRQQVVGRREQHHAADREHHQRVDLGVVEAAASTPAARPRCRAARRPGRRTRTRRPRGGARRTAARRRARSSRIRPHRNRSGRRPRCAPSTASDAAGHAVAERPSRSRGDHDRADERGDQAGERRARSGRGSAAARGRNASTRTPSAGDAEDEEQRPELGVLDGRA